MMQRSWNWVWMSPLVLGLLSATALSVNALETLTESEPKQTQPANELTTPAPLATSQPIQPGVTEANSLRGNFVPVASLANDKPMAQVTSVSQLSDVQPTDWAFQALQSLVERYGCIAGYPDGTYRGNRATTRYEFAAGLNACLDRINELIAAGTSDFVSKEDLATLQRLQEEFAAELATLRGRVDALEARTAELEANQFSTTTKLDGEVVFAVADTLTGDNAFGEEVDDATVLGYRARLNFNTSFTGEDLLYVRLQSANLDALSTTKLTPEGDLFFTADPFEEGSTDIGIDALLYSFPLTDNTEAVIIANAGAADDFASTVNPFLDGDGATGALSRFGTRNPIYYLVDGAGVGLRHEFGDFLEFNLGYLASEADDPSLDSGLFNGPYGAMAQLVFKPSDRLNIGLTYINSYNNETLTGSNLANPRNFLDLIESGISIPVISNSYGVELSWQLSDNFVIGGWAGYTFSRTLATGGGLLGRGDFETFNWAVNLTFPDLGKEGNLAGIIVGMEPRVVDADINVNLDPLALALLPPEVVAAAGSFGEDDDTSLHIEAFYQHQLTDNIIITPGIIWLTAPDHNSGNDDIVIGTIRTTFLF